jgi:hypothetical protein
LCGQLEHELVQARAQITKLTGELMTSERANNLMWAENERLIAALALAEARVTELEKDAKRYRWLWRNTVDRFHGKSLGKMYIANIRPSTDGINADVDAAISSLAGRTP